MANEMRRSALLNVIEQIELCRENQNAIDNVYGNLCSVILTKMEEKIPKSEGSTNKRLRFRKPYWNETLTDLWGEMRQKEKKYLEFKDSQSVKSALRRDNVQSRDTFDKTLRKTELAHKRTAAVDIETMNTSNLNEFWNRIRNLGPKKLKVSRWKFMMNHIL